MYKISSFASIENKTHPNIKKYNFEVQDSKNIIEDTDIEISKEIIQFIIKNNANIITGTGEWKWLEKNKRMNFLNTLRNQNVEKLANILVNMFRNDSTYGYISPSFSDIKNTSQVLSDILSNIDTCFEFTFIEEIGDLTTNKFNGNPFGLQISEKEFILPDTPRHFYYAHNISNLVGNHKKPFVLEIGGGYGGFANEISNLYTNNLCYLGIDLIPAIITTYYFLRKNNKNVNLLSLGEEIKNNSINLLPFNFFNQDTFKIPKPDIVFNSRSLCEMSQETINYYFSFINSLKPELIYHENSNFVLFPDSPRHLEIIGSDFPVDYSFYNKIFQSITPFTGGQGRYREFIYKLK